MISREQFKADVGAWAEEIGVEPKQIHIRSMKRKWASCSSRGRLTFDTSLLEQEREARDRAILHELLHLRFPNHGRMFRTLLNAHLQRGSGCASGAPWDHGLRTTDRTSEARSGEEP